MVSLKKKNTVKNSTMVAGEMAWWLRALAALSENLGSDPNTYMAAHNHL